MLKGFKDFALRGNVIDLAVAVVIGTAFTALVNSFTTSFLKPLIGLVSGGGVNGGTKVIDGQPFTYGAFLNALITFLITAAVLYFAIVLPMKVLLERRKHGEETGPVVPTQVELLVEIRDLLRSQQGRGPGTDPSGPGSTVLPGRF
jgi:large conductance mechanosensitive channel